MNSITDSDGARKNKRGDGSLDSETLQDTSTVDFAKLRMSDEAENSEDMWAYPEGSFTGYKIDIISPSGSVASSLSGSASDLLTMKDNAPRAPMSITFAKDIHLEDGSVVRVGRPSNSPSQPHGSIQGQAYPSENPSFRTRYARVQSESGMTLFDRRTGTPTGHKNAGQGHAPERVQPPRYRRGEMRHPLLQSTVDELALYGTSDAEIESISSGLEVTAAAEAKDVLPPLDTNVLGSPSETSPAGAFLGGRSSSFRSRNGNEMASSFGSTGQSRRRRSTTRMSPAQSFLMGFGAKQSGPPRPDDEGQEISDSKYIIGKQIGYGGFSVVKEAFTFEGGGRIKRAVKIVYKELKDVTEEENEKVQNAFDYEVSIWRYLHHPHILPLIEVHDTPFATFCITKLNEGGTLFDNVRARRRLPRDDWALPTEHAKLYLHQLATALRYLHEDMHIVHRDIKLENCLLDMSGCDANINGGHLLLCDFGLADYTHPDSRNTPDHVEPAKVGPSETSTSILGSINYIAPEVIASPGPLYHNGLDIWAFGVVAYTLLTGDLPFKNEYEPALTLSIERGSYKVEPLLQCRAVTSCEDGRYAVDLVRACLQVRTDKRWDVGELLASEWFAEMRQGE